MVLVRVDSRLTLAMMKVETAVQTLEPHDIAQFLAFTRSHLTETSNISLNDLGQLHCLSNRLKQHLMQTEARKVVVCANEDKETVTACVLFLGRLLLYRRRYLSLFRGNPRQPGTF